ncbi:MAG: YitT family protein, partial [Brachybacterium alimentarium]
QMALDVAVILLSLLVLDIPRVLLSALGGVILNVVLALNHRPGRYRA